MSDITKIAQSLSELKVSEMIDLVKHLETEWGVSASAPVAVASQSESSAVVEKTAFDVILTDSGASKISVIKEIRVILPALGLAEAKAIVDAAPKSIKEGVKKEEAEEIKKKLEAAGAKVEIK